METPGSVVAEQVEDEGLWFVAQTAPEAYLQDALRRLHAVIEGAGMIQTYDKEYVESLLAENERLEVEATSNTNESK